MATKPKPKASVHPALKIMGWMLVFAVGYTLGIVTHASSVPKTHGKPSERIIERVVERTVPPDCPLTAEQAREVLGIGK